ncbi:hypothetical protein D1871_07760 [Nakamurella silvestris]|nr:hypothetical protein D1871_07760 [Nakamurella silvestris]
MSTGHHPPTGMIYVAGAAGITVLGHDLVQAGDVVPVEELLYLIADPTGRWLFGVSGIGRGLAHSWRIDGCGLTRVGEPVGTGGAEPCHAVLDRTGRHLLVANYASGSMAILAVADDGALALASVHPRPAERGPDPDRQDGPHLHQAVLGADNEVLVTDLGTDRIISYLLEAGELTDPVVSAAPPGSGPRHLVLLPDNRIAVAGELSSQLLLAHREGRRATRWHGVPSTLRQPDERNYPSDITVSPDGSVILLANRGADTIGVFNAVDGTPAAEISCSSWPRQMALDGGRLLIAGTNNDRIDVLDLASRELTTGAHVSRPMCVVVT